ncbi:MAG: Holliday junction branch migration protein RuvA [bacterium]
MIAYIKGSIIVSQVNYVIVETGGLGYKVNLAQSQTFRSGEEAEFFIHEHIREESDDLYGFASIEQLELFEKLISVNGVGPKAGLSIMSVGSADEIITAIATENIAFFKSVSGIGQKVATKIILELKSKITGNRDTAGLLNRSSDNEDILGALTALGYQPKEINRLVAKIPGEIIAIEEKVRWCLQNLAK